MRDLIFVVKNDGTYEQVPNKNLRSQENYSDNFVVIANRVGVVKAKIKLLSRTDRVEVKYLVPSLESVSDLIGDKPYFQDYAQASVWRGAVPKKLLQEISMSYAGQIEVSFSFLKPVLDSRATNYKGDILTGDTLPETATNGDYYVIKVATYTIGEIVLKYGQTAIWDGAWVKGGTYQVIGTTTTQKMNVEPTLIGEEAEFDIDEADEIHEALEEHAQAITDLEGEVEDLELEINAIIDGETVVEKARADQYGQEIDQIYLTNVLPSTNYENDEINVRLYLKDGLNETRDQPSFVINKATAVLAGVMSATDKARLDELWAILQNSNDPTFVDTINEILAIFANYPEGMDIIAKFAEKVDKTTTINNHALSDNVRLTADDIFIEEAGDHYDSQNVEEAVEDLWQNIKSAKEQVPHFERLELESPTNNHASGFKYTSFGGGTTFKGRELYVQYSASSHFSTTDPTSWGVLMWYERKENGEFIASEVDIDYTAIYGGVRDVNLSVSNDGKYLFMKFFSNAGIVGKYGGYLCVFDKDLELVKQIEMFREENNVVWGNTLHTPNNYLLTTTYKATSPYKLELMRSTAPVTNDFNSVTFEIVATIQTTGALHITEANIGYFKNKMILVTRVDGSTARYFDTADLEGGTGWGNETQLGFRFEAPAFPQYIDTPYLLISGSYAFDNVLRKVALAVQLPDNTWQYAIVDDEMQHYGGYNAFVKNRYGYGMMYFDAAVGGTGTHLYFRDIDVVRYLPVIQELNEKHYTEIEKNVVKLNNKTDKIYTDALFNEASDNLVVPDLVGKTQVGGIYTLYSGNGTLTIKYNVYTGEFIINGQATTNNYYISIGNQTYEGTIYHRYEVVSGTVNDVFYIDPFGNGKGYILPAQNTTLIGSGVKSATPITTLQFGIENYLIFSNLTFRLMLSTEPRTMQVPVTPQLHALKLGHITNLNWQFVNEAKQDKIEDTGWIALSLVNGWTNDATDKLSIRKIGKIVYMRGIINGTARTGTEVATIPAGYRVPINTSLFCFIGGNLDTNMTIRPVAVRTYNTLEVFSNSANTKINTHYFVE